MKINYLKLLLTLLSIIPCFLVGQTFDKYPHLQNAHVGVLVKDMSGYTVFSFQDKKSFVPASVTKLITTATSLEKLTSTHEYTTRLAYSGVIINGVLGGDIIIYGSGDPTLGSEYFPSHNDFISHWIDALQRLGVNKIEGDVIVDASVFDKQVVPNKWIWEDIANYYGAACYGVSFSDNRYRLTFSKTEIGGKAEVESIMPSINGLNVESHVTGANNNRDNAYVYGGPWSFDKQVYGTIPAAKESFTIKGAMPNPPLVLADVLLTSLVDSGIEVDGESKAVWEKYSADTKIISVYKSPNLSEIVRVTNKVSNNLFAEHLLKTLAVNDTEASTLQNAIDAQVELWTQKGIVLDGVRLYDGSGLSRANLMTPRFIVEVIRYMLQSNNAECYLNSFAIAGQDGTFRTFLDNTIWEGKVMGKSGSMSGVRCYAGTVIGESGKRYVFTIMVNNFTTPSGTIKKQIESYLTDLFSKVIL